MIRIRYEPEIFSITIKGHAGAARPGQDIVCAGVSALTNALLGRAALHNAQEDAPGGGVAFARCYPAPEDEPACREMLETVMEGFRAIAEIYPRFVTVEESADCRAGLWPPRNDRTGEG